MSSRYTPTQASAQPDQTAGYGQQLDAQTITNINVLTSPEQLIARAKAAGGVITKTRVIDAILKSFRVDENSDPTFKLSIENLIAQRIQESKLVNENGEITASPSSQKTNENVVNSTVPYSPRQRGVRDSQGALAQNQPFNPTNSPSFLAAQMAAIAGLSHLKMLNILGQAGFNSYLDFIEYIIPRLLAEQANHSLVTPSLYSIIQKRGGYSPQDIATLMQFIVPAIARLYLMQNTQSSTQSISLDTEKLKQFAQQMASTLRLSPADLEKIYQSLNNEQLNAQKSVLENAFSQGDKQTDNNSPIPFQSIGDNEFNSDGTRTSAPRENTPAKKNESDSSQPEQGQETPSSPDASPASGKISENETPSTTDPTQESETNNGNQADNEKAPQSGSINTEENQQNTETDNSAPDTETPQDTATQSQANAPEQSQNGEAPETNTNSDNSANASSAQNIAKEALFAFFPAARLMKFWRIGVILAIIAFSLFFTGPAIGFPAVTRVLYCEEPYKSDIVVVAGRTAFDLATGRVVPEKIWRDCNDACYENQAKNVAANNEIPSCLKNELARKSDNDTINFWRSNGGRLSVTAIPVKDIKSVISAGQEAGVSSEVITFVLSLMATETGGQENIWGADNGLQCYGVAQICAGSNGGNSFETWTQKAMGRVVSPDEFLRSPAIQMKTIAVGYQSKRDLNAFPDKPPIYGAAARWLGVGCDVNGTCDTDYGEAAARNFKVINCQGSESNTTPSSSPTSSGQQATIQNTVTNILSALAHNTPPIYKYTLPLEAEAAETPNAQYKPGTKQEISFTKNGRTITGFLYVPESWKPTSNDIILVNHDGFTGDPSGINYYESNKNFASQIATGTGKPVFLIDFERNKTQPINYLLVDDVQDNLDSIDSLPALIGVSGSPNVTIVGSSRGSTTAALTASKSDKVTALNIAYPVPKFSSWSGKNDPVYTKYNQNPQDLKDITFKNANISITLWTGDNDEVLRAGDANYITHTKDIFAAWSSKYKNTNMKIIENANHGFVRLSSDKLNEKEIQAQKEFLQTIGNFTPASPSGSATGLNSSNCSRACSPSGTQSANLANINVSCESKAFLKAIQKKESNGNYNVRFPSTPYQGDRHPGILGCGPTTDGVKCSDAAGANQMISTTLMDWCNQINCLSNESKEIQELSVKLARICSPSGGFGFKAECIGSLANSYTGDGGQSIQGKELPADAPMKKVLEKIPFDPQSQDEIAVKYIEKNIGQALKTAGTDRSKLSSPSGPLCSATAIEWASTPCGSQSLYGSRDSGLVEFADVYLTSYKETGCGKAAYVQQKQFPSLASLFGIVDTFAATKPQKYSDLSDDHRAFLKEIATKKGYIEYKDAKMNDGNGKNLQRDAQNAFNELRTYINTKTGKNIEILSGYRSYDAQVETFFSNINTIFDPASPDKNAQAKFEYSERMTSSTAPAFSEHSTGYVFDYWVPSIASTANLDRTNWPKDIENIVNGVGEHAGKLKEFGLELSYPQNSSAGAAYEPWHIRYIGKNGENPLKNLQVSTISRTTSNDPCNRVSFTSAPGDAFVMYGIFTSPYGQRNGRLHAGLDIAWDMNTPILSYADGNVAFIGELRGYGTAVIVSHPQLGIETLYAHTNGAAPGIKTGSNVTKGQFIAYMGNTGVGSGPHLHFETRKLNPNGQSIPVDPCSSYIKCPNVGGSFTFPPTWTEEQKNAYQALKAR